MFQVWKYDANSDQMHNLWRTHNPETARFGRVEACYQCNGKKVKCSGHKDGCTRCKARGYTCEYNGPGSRRRRKDGRQSKSSSPARDSRDGSGSPSSSHESWQEDPSLEPKSTASSRHHSVQPATSTTSTTPTTPEFPSNTEPLYYPMLRMTDAFEAPTSFPGVAAGGYTLEAQPSNWAGQGAIQWEHSVPTATGIETMYDPSMNALAQNSNQQYGEYWEETNYFNTDHWQTYQ